MVQKLDKYGNTSIDNGKIIVIDKYGNIKQVTSGGGSPTGPAGGDLSGTYPNPSVVWSNGAPIYDLLYYPLSSNPAGYITSAALTNYVPNTRTLTINGTSYDLSVDRVWNVGTVTSVGISMPSAFSVSGSPVTGSSTITVGGAGLSSQYIKGDGTLGNLPSFSGGGASVVYYLNGGTNQGTFVGNTYYQMSKSAILGSAANFSTNSNGYIAQFITNANDPSLLSIPAGNWNFEMYFSASSPGGSPSFYLELYKYDGVSFSLIASSSIAPETITNGTTVDLYTTAISVPSTILSLTDRLAIRVYVNTSGRTITLYTQDSHLCQVTTTFTTGITALNGLTEQVQNFAIGSTGTDFSILSSGSTHTFNIPTASASNRGLLSTIDWSTFNNKQNALSGTGFVKISGTTISYDNTTYYPNSNPSNFISLTALSSIATGLTYTNTTGVFSLTSGYVIPTTTEQSNWNTAYTNRITSLTTTGSSGSATLSSNTLNIPTYTLSGLGGVSTGRTLTINGTALDLSADRSWSVGTVTSVAALTLGTSGTDLSSSVATGTTTPVITLNVPTASATNRGALSSADWTTFNNKQPLLDNLMGLTMPTGYITTLNNYGAVANLSFGSNAANSNNICIYQFFYTDKTITIDELYLSHTGTNDGASATVTLYFFDDNNSGLPGTLLQKETTATGILTTGSKIISFTNNITLQAGGYWIGIHVRGLNTAGSNPTFYFSAVNNNYRGYQSAAISYTNNFYGYLTSNSSSDLATNPTIIFQSTTASIAPMLKIKL